ncbi:MAG TPA: hypothetical protein EYH12_06365 [Psychromonas hadalis]|nr:hypothetical protein [Psychromonas hadalis]
MVVGALFQLASSFKNDSLTAHPKPIELMRQLSEIALFTNASNSSSLYQTCPSVSSKISLFSSNWLTASIAVFNR